MNLCFELIPTWSKLICSDLIWFDLIQSDSIQSNRIRSVIWRLPFGVMICSTMLRIYCLPAEEWRCFDSLPCVITELIGILVNVQFNRQIWLNSHTHHTLKRQKLDNRSITGYCLLNTQYTANIRWIHSECGIFCHIPMTIMTMMIKSASGVGYELILMFARHCTFPSSLLGSSHFTT